METVLTMASL